MCTLTILSGRAPVLMVQVQEGVDLRHPVYQFWYNGDLICTSTWLAGAHPGAISNPIVSELIQAGLASEHAVPTVTFSSAADACASLMCSRRLGKAATQVAMTAQQNKKKASLQKLKEFGFLGHRVPEFY